MNRHDDPALVGDIKVYRRIPPTGDRVQWDDNGNPSPSSQNFKDRNEELSVFIAGETTVERVLQGHDGFGLVEFTLKQVRDAYAECNLALKICRDETDDAGPGHVLICGRPTGSVRNKLKACAVWVAGKWPTKIDEPDA